MTRRAKWWCIYIEHIYDIDITEKRCELKKSLDLSVNLLFSDKEQHFSYINGKLQVPNSNKVLCEY